MRPIFGPILAAIACLSLLAACGSGADAPVGSPSPLSSSSVSADDPTSNAKDRDVVADPPLKTWKDALKAAQAEFGGGDVTTIELEAQESGRLEYELEFLLADTKYEVEYDADTLAKLSDERESVGDDAVKERKRIVDLDWVIDLEQAAGATRNQQAGSIREWTLEGKDTGLLQYEFDIRAPGASQDIEVQINAQDGSVIKGS